MKTASIRILNQLWEKVKTESHASLTDESVAFLTANYFETPEKIVFLPEHVVPAKPSDYLSRSNLHLKVSPIYISRVLNIAEDSKNTVIMVHSHPFETGKPMYSPSDDFGESKTSETISKCLYRTPPVGSLLVAPNGISARAWLGLSKKSVPASATVLDEMNYRIYPDLPKSDFIGHTLVDRQLRVLGKRNQDELESLDIGIVGLGGTGSSVAEQLVRMGITKLRLVDHDLFEPSNWSRLYGSSWKDIARNRPKVALVSSYLKKINPKISCKSIEKSVMTKEVLHNLSNCDIIFSCLDRHGPRAVLNELSYQCFIPVIDVGVGLTRNNDGMLGGSIRATIIGPGLPCLLCQEIVRPEMITAENLSPQEYASRRAEGYVNEREQNAPSVVSYTTLAGSLGLIIFLDFISGNSCGSFSTLLFDLSSKETMKLRSDVKPDCVCQKRLGKGFHFPFSVAD
jgi:hypothetical protein